MKDLFIMGGAPYMSVLTLLLFVIIGSIIYSLASKQADKLNERLTYIKYVGIIALTFGILGQVMGIQQIFSYLGEVGSVKPHVMYGGLRVTTIPTVYGMLIFMLSLLPMLTVKWMHVWKKE